MSDPVCEVCNQPILKGDIHYYHGGLDVPPIHDRCAPQDEAAAELARLTLENEALKLLVKMRPAPEVREDISLINRNAELTAEVERLRADAGRHQFMMADLRWQVFSEKRGAKPIRYAMRHDGERWGGWHDTPNAAIDAAIKEVGNGS